MLRGPSVMNVPLRCRDSLDAPARSEFNKRLIESRKTVTLRRNCHMECVSKVDTLFIKGDRARQRVWGLTVMVCPPTNARNASAMTAGGRL